MWFQKQIIQLKPTLRFLFASSAPRLPSPRQNSRSQRYFADWRRSVSLWRVCSAASHECWAARRAHARSLPPTSSPSLPSSSSCQEAYGRVLTWHLYTFQPHFFHLSLHLLLVCIPPSAKGYFTLHLSVHPIILFEQCNEIYGWWL